LGDAGKKFNTAEDFCKLSARPSHHVQADGAIEDFKKRMARPVCKRLYNLVLSVRDNVSGLRTIGLAKMEMRASWPLISFTASKRQILNQDSRTPVDCQAISLSPPANIVGFRVS
jgi:hypothetical protein